MDPPQWSEASCIRVRGSPHPVSRSSRYPSPSLHQTLPHQTYQQQHPLATRTAATYGGSAWDNRNAIPDAPSFSGSSIRSQPVRQSSVESATSSKTGFEGGVGFEAAAVEEGLTASSIYGARFSSQEDLVKSSTAATTYSSRNNIITAGTATHLGGYTNGYANLTSAPTTRDAFPSRPITSSPSSRTAGFPKHQLGGQLGDQLGNAPLGTVTHDQTTTELYPQDFEEDPPLLEELGINPDDIAKRIKAALLFYRLDHDLLVDVDMSGPLLIASCLGCSLLLSGKIHFGYIYGLSVASVLLMCILLNLMSQGEVIDLYRTTSILGYGLLPVDMLALISVFISLRNWVGTVLSIVCVIWCTATASRFFETALQMHHQRFLVAYPVALIYACFVLITVF